jgi:hypothetical protein
MNKTVPILTALLLSAALNASALVTITVDENGNGTWDGTPLSSAGILAPDTGPGGLPNALTYYLGVSVPPPAGTTIGYVQPGDLIIREQASGPFSDLIRFRAGDPNFFIPASLVFYSDNSDGADSLADIGFPTAFNANTFTIVESGVEGGLQMIHYEPLPGQPGYVDDPANPGHAYAAYNFISDVPEPTTASLAGIFLLMTGGWNLMRRKVRN